MSRFADRIVGVNNPSPCLPAGRSPQSMESNERIHALWEIQDNNAWHFGCRKRMPGIRFLLTRKEAFFNFF